VYLFQLDKTIKLWKVSQREKRIADGNWNLRDYQGIQTLDSRPDGQTELVVPKLAPMDLLVEASPRRIYANCHTYHVHSISANSDQETFLSADDLRINLWHLEVTNQSYSNRLFTLLPSVLNKKFHVLVISDIKPANMEELTEVITCAEFHPQECNWFAYSSSKGLIRMCDMRERALCDQHAKSEIYVILA
jgi:serine/threonine-protein phosphatase 2A regulatory subunit B